MVSLSGVMMRRLGVVGVTVTMIIGSFHLPMASADETGQPVGDDVSTTPVAQANPDVPLEILASLPGELQQSSIRVDDSITADTIIVDTDGNAYPGQEQKLARSRGLRASSTGCEARVVGLPGGHWTPYVPCQVGVAGHPGFTMSYEWERFAFSEVSKGCACGKGYQSTADKGGTCYVIGFCPGFEGRRTKIPWGNVLAMPAVKAKTGGITGLVIDWRH